MCRVFLHEGALHKISVILWFYPWLVQYAMYIWLCKTFIYALSKQIVGACLLSKSIIMPNLLFRWCTSFPYLTCIFYIYSINVHSLSYKCARARWGYKCTSVRVLTFGIIYFCPNGSINALLSILIPRLIPSMMWKEAK